MTVTATKGRDHGASTAMMSRETTLRKIYYDASHPASFSSVDRLYRAANATDASITRSDVEEFLSAQPPYTLHRRVVRKFPRNKTVARHHGDLAQADLIDVKKYRSSNNDIHYILTLIDVFSKYAYAVPVKRKTAANVSQALATIFKEYRPSKLQTDEGREFTNKQVQQLLKQQLIHFYIAKNEVIKCAIIERFQRTLQSRMHKYFTAFNTHTWTDKLADFMHAYNTSYHRSIKTSPERARNEDPRSVFARLYGFSTERDMIRQSLLSKPRPRLKHGDTVRAAMQASAFAKGYDKTFSDAVFTVKSTASHQRHPTFKLIDDSNRVVPGSYYSHEIQKIRDTDLVQ